MNWSGFDRESVAAVRKIPGRSYVEKPHKHWHVPLDLETCRRLREYFGDRLELGPELKAWGWRQVRQESQLQSIAAKDTAELKRLPMVLPQLYDAIHLGPLGKHMTEGERALARQGPGSYQCADVEFLSQSPGPLNANHQGLGKTVEWIATIWEAGIEDGDHLIICPKAAAEGTWEGELTKWQAEALEQVGIYICVNDSEKERQRTIDSWLNSTKRVRWVVVNPHMLMMKKDRHRLAPLTLAAKGKKIEVACTCQEGGRQPHEHYQFSFPEMYDVQWRSICIDEAHRGVIRNHKTLTFKSLSMLDLHPNGKRCAMTGTPMKKLGGVDIWGILNWLNPKAFTSFWRFADSYFEVTDNGFGKKVGGLRREKEESFFRMLIPYALRRTKAEAAPWLPDKLYIDVDVQMSKPQARQYRQMHAEAMARLGSAEVGAGGLLAQITRLKQFANAHCRLEGDNEITPIHSPKVDAMLGKMEEVGMFDEGADRKQLVFSQSRRMCNFIAGELREAGLETEMIVGGMKDRKGVIDRFMNGSTRVLVIVTTAGGTSLTLDAAEDVHLIDEMWAPDDDEQAEDRVHRVSRIHQVTVYTYRSVGTVDEDIALSKMEKKESHELILDVRRNLMRART